MSEPTGASEELAELRARVAELELRNRELTVPADGAGKGRSGGGRGVIALVLILVSVLLAPIAVLGIWARTQLVDTDRFVETFAPLAEQPEVQALVTDQVTQGIEDNVDIDALVSDLFAGAGDLGLPPRAMAALPLLEGPAAAGMRELTRSAVEQLVASPQFAVLWEGALRQTHIRTVAVIQGDPNRLVALAEDGTLTVELGPVIEGAKQALVEQGFGFAERIPAIERSIPVVASDSLVTVRTVYQVAVAVGYWLPWIVLALLVVGVLAARDRAHALAWAGGGLAVSLLVLAGVLGIGKQYYAGAVSPSIMPTATAQVIFDQLTQILSAGVLALVVLSLFVAIGGWLSSSYRPARVIRGAADSGFTSVRATADRRGLGTGNVGRVVDRWRSALVAATIGLGVFALFQTRPITVGGVVTIVLIVLVGLVVIELVRRPATADDDEPEAGDAEAPSESAAL
ncbi:hypothetical protein [Millisia brevis]|uniref:hypothetical protein n=1 Tax=Millisia brevis TaxID=264148 RepID=UPI0008375485|nr:hypothetical protein [Millisia brevis]